MQKIDAASPDAKSADLLAGNIAALKALFPELLSERIVDGQTTATINVDVLKGLVGDATVTDAEEKYGLNWHGKRRARQLALTPSAGTLRPSRDESVDWDTTQNLMIEGDNLEVLKLLQRGYAGKVKLIYIDPPYNTGKDFVYPDNFQDNIKNYLELTGQVEGGQKIASNTEASGRFHTDWLNMIYPRLKIARALMQDSGLLFLSLDDSEIGNARRVCDEIFGEENFVDCMVWKKRYGGGAKERYLVTLHEYILVYAKALDTISEIEVPLSEASVDRYYTLRDEYVEERGPFRIRPLEAMKSFEDRPNLCFPISAPDGTLLMPKRQWRWSKDRMDEAISRSEVAFLMSKDGAWTAHSKQYLKDDTGETRSAKAFSIIDGIYTQAGTNETVEMFGDARVFSFPKPTALIRKVIEIATSDDKDAVILDFFAGSGTTGHAVLEQNAADSGTRRYILIQLPESLDPESKEQKVAADYCKHLGKPARISELTKERLRRAGARTRTSNPMFSGDTGFRVFKLDTSNIRAWNPNRDDLNGSLLENLEHIQPGRTDDDVLYEILLKLGLDLCVPIERRSMARAPSPKSTSGKSAESAFTVHSIGGGVLMACLDASITVTDAEPLALGIIEWHKSLAPAGDTTCIFRDSAFENDVAKSNLAAILEQHGIKQVRSL